MKKLIFIIIVVLAFVDVKAQFPTTDSLRDYNIIWITNNSAKAFTNYRLHTLLAGMIDWIDSARTEGGGGSVGIDSIGVLNDSTLRYRKSGIFYSVTFKGGAVAHDNSLTGTGFSASPLKVDTTIIKTVADAQRVTDSLVALLALKLNISDTTAMLAPFHLKVDSIHIYTAADPDPDSIYQYIEGDSTLVGYIPKGGAATVNLDTTRNATSVTITNDAGTNAVIPLVNFAADLAGLMSGTDKGRLDSLYNGLLNDSIVIVSEGQGEIIGYVRNDTIGFKRVYDSTYIGWATLSDSSLVAVLDTAGLRTWIETFAGGGGAVGGSDTEIIWNNSGASDGTENMNWDATNTGLTITKNALGTTQNNSTGFLLSNTNASTSGNQEITPPYSLYGTAFATTPAASQPYGWQVYGLGVQGSTAPTSQLLFRANINGGAFATRLTINSNAKNLDILSTGLRCDGCGISLSGGSPVANTIGTGSLLNFSTVATPNANTFGFSAGAGYAQVSGTSSLLQLSEGTTGFAPTSGIADYAHLWTRPRINQTGTANGIPTGIRIEPNIIALNTPFRGLDLTQTQDWAIFQRDAGARSYFAGQVRIGDSSDAGASYTLQNTGSTYLDGGLLKLGASGKSTFNNGLYDAAHGSIILVQGTINDPLTAGSGSRSRSSSVEFESNPLTATNTSVTHDTSSTVCIENAPSASTNMTITNPYSLIVAKGLTYMGGGLQMKDLPTGDVGDQVLVQKSDLTTGVLSSYNFLQQFYGKSTSVSGSPVTLITIPTVTDSAYSIEVDYRGADQSVDGTVWKRLQLIVVNNSGTVTIENETTDFFIDGGTPPTYTTTITVSSTNILVQITGDGLGATQRWIATARVQPFQWN